MGKVYLVGAGPGDAKLITLKGIEKLKKCDAVVYDRLAANELLDYVPLECEKIYVGKEAGKHYKNQEEINKILVACAKRHKIVVRLKGGDPFVFGRGGEEIEALNQYKIPFEIVPGVTSAISVPESVGIPVTHRGVSRSFHVITGHTESSMGSPDYDYETLAKTEGTLIFLMGLSNLEDIAEKLILAGKDKDTPAAVISDGTTKYQRVVRGKLFNIANRVRQNDISSPAIIVVGETAEYEYIYQKQEQKKIGITASKILRKKLEDGFSEIGLDPVNICDMKIVLTEKIQMLESELERIKEYQWVIFTSQNGIKIFFDTVRKKQIDFRNLCNLRFAVLGSGTAGKLAEYGFQADFIPSEYTVSALSEQIVKIIGSNEKVLIPRAAQGSRELTRTLKKKNIDFVELAIYDVEGSLNENIKCLEQLDYLVFVSSSGVRAFFENLPKGSMPERIRIACIGNRTHETLLNYYDKGDIVGKVNNVDGLLNAVKGEVRNDKNAQT